MRPFQAALDTCLGSLFFASLSVHGLRFTVYAASIFAHLSTFFFDLGVPLDAASSAPSTQWNTPLT